MVNSTLSKSKKDLPEKKDKGNTPQNHFAFENEVRIFIIDSDQNIEKKDAKILSVSDFKYSKELIKEVKLSPLTPFSNSDFRKKFYKQKQSFEFESIKEELQNKIKNINVTYSKLYSDVTKIEKVPKE